MSDVKRKKVTDRQLELPVAFKPRVRVPRSRPPENALSVAGLFAGVGGVELGMARAGHEANLLCEFEPSASAVLAERFPKVPKHGDIRTLRKLPPGTDLVTAGFPCQDLSQAGKTVGIAGSRSGLVGEVFRLLERQRVPWVLLENVPFMLQLAKGQALNVIVAAIEALGYQWAYRVIDSRSMGLPQRRERVYLLASREGDPRDVLLTDDVGEPAVVQDRHTAFGFYWTEGVRGLGWAVNAVPTLKGGSTVGIASPPAILLPNGNVVKPEIRDAERLQGFASDWTKPAEEILKAGFRWKLVGNAVTVDVAEWIGRKLRKPGEYRDEADFPLRSGAPWPRAAWGSKEGRYVATVSAWPVRRAVPNLIDFLKYPTEPLSHRATAGFLSRARSGSLRFPPDFLESLDRHLARMSRLHAA